jgi:hypothetical protein
MSGPRRSGGRAKGGLLIRAPIDSSSAKPLLNRLLLQLVRWLAQFHFVVSVTQTEPYTTMSVAPPPHKLHYRWHSSDRGDDEGGPLEGIALLTELGLAAGPANRDDVIVHQQLFAKLLRKIVTFIVVAIGLSYDFDR